MTTPCLIIGELGNRCHCRCGTPDVGVPRNHGFRVREDAKNSAESFSKASRSSDDRRVPAIYRLQTEKPIIATSI